MINKRIQAIAELIRNDSSVIDIGCDHGYLALQLRKQGNNNLIICCDEKKGPLENAKRNLQSFDNILFYCTDGVKDIYQQTDVAVIAGMGHNTVEHILQQSDNYFRNCKQIIIQVNQTVSSMRRFLMENNYRIVNEKIIEDYKFYEILCVENGRQELNAEQIEFGPILMKEKTETFRRYYQQKADYIRDILKDIGDNHPDRDILEKKLKMISKILFAK
ncbi:MAG: class I SAM-dependent methyltransferase [Erysipelotrichia bacterium]|nr:class I SAM-dependent methyltransferase [Erysipelotrichia bacterium]